MDVLVLTGYDDAMASIGDRCVVTHKAYAERHGYKQETVREYDTLTHPSHQKLRFVKERIANFDAIIWFDADTVVTDAKHYRLEDFREGQDGGLLTHVMDISVDWCAPPEDDNGGPIRTHYVSCGNFIVWNTPNTSRFISEWEAASKNYATRSICCWEQDGLRAAMRNPWFNAQVDRWHRKCLNAVHPTCVNRNFPDGAPKPWEEGDFLLHLTNVDRAAILNSLGL